MTTLLNVGEMSALALHVMAELTKQADADPERRLSVADLAEHLCASSHTLHKVVSKLVAAGMADSARGAAGGVRLADGGGERNLLAVIEAVEGEFRANGCLFAKRVCPVGAPCSFHHLTNGLENHIRDYFARTTVRELAAAESAPKTERKTRKKQGEHSCPARNGTSSI